MNTSETGRYTTVKLKPLLQDFLRGYFQCHELVFTFPPSSRKLWLPCILQESLSKPPEDYIHSPADYGESTFHITVPKSDFCDPDVHTYMSGRAHQHLVSRIEDFFRVRFNEEMTRLRALNIKKNYAVTRFMEQYEISLQHEDALLKQYSRYLNNMHQTKWRKKTKKST